MGDCLRSYFTLGIFTARDPFEGMHDTPMSLNGYSYVHGNPIMHTDPSGMIIEAATPALVRAAMYIISVVGSVSLSTVIGMLLAALALGFALHLATQYVISQLKDEEFERRCHDVVEQVRDTSETVRDLLSPVPFPGRLPIDQVLRLPFIPPVVPDQSILTFPGQPPFSHLLPLVPPIINPILRLPFPDTGPVDSSNTFATGSNGIDDLARRLSDNMPDEIQVILSVLERSNVNTLGGSHYLSEAEIARVTGTTQLPEALIQTTSNTYIAIEVKNQNEADISHTREKFESVTPHFNIQRLELYIRNGGAVEGTYRVNNGILHHNTQSDRGAVRIDGHTIQVVETNLLSQSARGTADRLIREFLSRHGLG